MTGEQLWASILQEAISGRLVPQLDSEPEVKQIGEAPKEVPFEIPKKWKWVRIDSVSLIKQGGTPKTNEYTYWNNGTIPWITPADLGRNKEKKYISKGERFITQKGLDHSSAFLVPENSIIYSSRAPIGYIAIAKNYISTNQGCKSIIPNKKYIYFDWIYYSLINRTDDIISRASGTTFLEISTKKFSETLIPLPPIQEQQRIVDRLNELKSLVDEYDAAHKELVEIESALPERLKASLIQEAIQGKLVPQLDSEPEVKQIGEAPKEVPFEIPKKWKWVRIDSVSLIKQGGTPKTNEYTYWNNGTIPWITPADLGRNKEKKYISKGERFITQKGLDHSSAFLVPENSIIYSSRAPIGYIAIAKNYISTNQGCKSIIPNKKYIYFDWIYYSLINRTDDIISRASGTTFLEISTKKFSETLIPLPPIQEQQRIVDKLKLLQFLIK